MESKTVFLDFDGPMEIKTVFLDFDGVLTDNFVYVNEKGEESVRCSREDGIGFDALRKHKIEVYLISTEKNPVVEKRANKWKVFCHQGVWNKKEKILELSRKFEIDLSKSIFIGNDINDLPVAKLFRYLGCPIDANIKFSLECNVTFTTKGGHGVVRELAEKLGLLNDLYNS